MRESYRDKRNRQSRIAREKENDIENRRKNQRRKENLFSRHLLPLVKGRWHGKRECEHCHAEIHPHGLCEKAGLALSKNVCGRRLFWYEFPKTELPEHD